MTDSITVHVPDHTTEYEIDFISDLDSLWSSVRKQIGDRKFLAVTDKNVLEKVKGVSGFDPVVIKPGESEKNLKNIEIILQGGFEKELDRHSVLVAIGGGVIGDMTGFAASLYMRGIPVIQVPTTLLAMVDSSIGGKTGVDCAQGKNLIGSFHAPERVIICREALDTLPKEEIQNGLGEMIKHGILGDEKHFEDLETLSQSLPRGEKQSKKNLDVDGIFGLVQDSIAVKHKIVESDERESGIRGFLNLGHTFGHAIEHISKYEIPHGRAVAIGCVMAANFALDKEMCDEETVDRIENIFHQFGIETFCDFPESEIFAAMKTDKKQKDGKVKLVLPRKIGEVEFYEILLSEYI